ncbi:MAG: TraR/DksA C4-type zinc finger protein [Peptococcaceae bacterium]|nr:TraR/DksA C4-type zinc finger protein [Peptococcaceae bacterium]
MITQEMKQDLRQRLENEKQLLMERIRGIDQGGLHEPLSASISELSLYDNHPGDVGSEVFERSKDFALRENAMLVMNAIDDALEKMEKGTYGLCDVCGEEIPAARLQAVPYTTLCIRCKRGDEQLPRAANRPVEEEVLADIYARPFNDKIDSKEFDWEDSFQEVARWNEHAVRSRAGSYYGAGEFVEEEQRGTVEDVDSITYEVGDDGVFYQSFRSVNDDDAPREVIDVGEQHTERDAG